MKICLISNNNGWGLTKDVKFLKDVLVGHEVKFQQWEQSNVYPGKFHINIHLEMVGGRHFRNARYNWLIPNQEWFLQEWSHRKGRFDKVLCKTHHAVDIFTQLQFANIRHLGFSTPDIYNSNVSRAFECIHVAGNSKFKGTEQVIMAWLENPHWPILHLYNVWEDLKIKAKNIDYHYGKVDEAYLREMQNKCLYHIQPSNAEGFGHVIYEGLAVGATVISTNAPPMNEIPNIIITKAEKTGNWHYGTLYTVAVNDLITQIDKVLNWSKSELQTNQKASRQAYLTNDATFKQRIYHELRI